MVDQDGDAHPITGGRVECNPQIQYPQPIGDPAGFDSDEFDMTANWNYNTDTDFAEVTFVLPVDYVYGYSPASETPFAVTENVFEMTSGYLVIVYQGTINDVLGAMWWQGFTHLEVEDTNGGDVIIDWEVETNICKIQTDYGSETMVLEWTAPTNLPPSTP